MSRIIATTERLVLREFAAEDARHFFWLNSFPEALLYTGDRAFRDEAEAREFLLGYDHYQRHGFGRWSLFRRDDEQYLGFCGLRRGAEAAVDLGFRIAPPCWGQGYATEAGFAALRVGFEEYELARVIARAMPENLASHRVLNKLGFQGDGEERDRDGTWLRFELSKQMSLMD